MGNVLHGGACSDRIMTMLQPERKSLWRRWHLGALLIQLGLAVLFTWPLVLNFIPGAGTMVPGFMREDRDQNLWNLWWTRTALLGGHNPFVTNMIWYPTPISLYYHTLNVFNGILAVPLMTVFSLQTTYNIVVLFSFAATGYGAYLLFHYLCGNKWAAFVGSLVFAFSAYHIATMRSLLQLISLEWVPFFILFFMKAVFAPAWENRNAVWVWAWRRALPAGFFLFMVSLVDWYYTMYSLILAGMITLYLLMRFLFERMRHKTSADFWHAVGEPWVRAAACVVVYLVLVSPILIPMFKELRQTDSMLPTADAAMTHSADLLTFFQPERGNQLWGGLFLNRDQWPYGSERYEVYFTYTALFLAGAALFATKKLRPKLTNQDLVAADLTDTEAMWTGGAPTRASEALPSATEELRAVPDAGARGIALPGKWFWAFGLVLFFLLALGPVLQINGVQIKWLFSPNMPLVMPYQLIGELPVLSISRSPDRFDMPLTLCLAALAGYGLNVLLGRWWRNWKLPKRGAVLCTGALALILVEIAPIPYPQLKADVPAWFYQLGEDPGDYSILEMPPQNDFWHGAYRMYFQTVHDKKIFGGYISREYPHLFLASTPGYQELQTVDGLRDMFADGPHEWYSAFEQYDTRYIVLYKTRAPHRIDPPVDVTPSRDAIKMVLGENAKPSYEDDQLEVYDVPKPPTKVAFVSVGDGWQPRENGPNGTYRWMADSATLRIDSPEASQEFLTFKASGLGPPRRLQVYHGDTLVFDEEVSALQTYTTDGPLGLPGGVSTLRFVSPEGTTSPSQLGMNTDPRQLSFAIMQVALVPVEK